MHADRSVRSAGARLKDPVALDGEDAARLAQAQDGEQLVVDEELLARHAQRAGDREEEVLLGRPVAKRGVEDAREEASTAEAALLALDDGLEFLRRMRFHAREDRMTARPAQ